MLHDLIWYAIMPTLLLAASVVVVMAFWPVHGSHEVVLPADQADTRSLQQRWEDGPPTPRRPRPEVGSMSLWDEAAWRREARCDDTGEHYGTMILPAPRMEQLNQIINQITPGGGPGPVPHVCPRCEAPDDGPHYQGCPFYDPDEAALFTDQLAVLRPIEARARVLDPDAWRPYLSAEEFAGQFPGVPYAPGDDGPHTGDLIPVSAELADQFDRLAEETADWLAQRAAAHADTRARMILAWQTLWQH